MLDENLPNYLFKPVVSDSFPPPSSILLYAYKGNEPTPAMVVRRPDPSSSRNAYAAALVDAAYPDIVYAEVLVRPETSSLQPSQLTTTNATATENRRDRSHSKGGGKRRSSSGPSSASSPPPGTDSGVQPSPPDVVVLRLYNPDQNVGIKHVSSTWGRGTWEFEMPKVSFFNPSMSLVDRESGASTGAVTAGLEPRVVFHWKPDRPLSKDMTCFMSGKSIDGRKSKDPDITVAMYKGGRDEAVTIYDPNLQRVDVQDRKGLEIVLLLGAVVIRDVYLEKRSDTFNLAASSRPNSPSAMLGPAGAATARRNTIPSSAAVAPTLDDETIALRESVAAEEERAARDREKRDRAEQQDIARMLEEEDRQRARRRDAEVAEETERLRQMYGTQAADYGSLSEGPAPPPPPPRPAQAAQPAAQLSPSAQPSTQLSGTGGSPAARPLSWFRSGSRPGPAGTLHDGAGKLLSGAREGLGLVYNGVSGASSSGFFGRGSGEGTKLTKKKSVGF